MQLFVPTHPALPIILMEPVVYEESPLADYLKGKKQRYLLVAWRDML